MIPIDPSRPFVLLDDARPAGAGPIRFYRDPRDIVATADPSAVLPSIERLRAASRAGYHIAGYLSYEAGLAFEEKLAPLAGSATVEQPPLLWFGIFDAFETIGPGDMHAMLGDPASAWAGRPKPRTDRAAYRDAVARILDLIAAGDIYQANLTYQADVPVAGPPLALYARLRTSGEAGWGGVVHDGVRWLLSCSPELFFTISAGDLTARPMKGTAPASSDPRLLREDAKQRAENLMIVDLLRNDLSRIAVPGSVAVPSLFEIETYPTVLQMTSTVTARLAANHDAIDVLRAIYPCGSVTGAPKIRAMEIIAEIETEPRGPYTGSIGMITPDGDAAFNVAIRTLMIAPGDRMASMGLGSAIVADSSADAEWRECLAKGAFVTAASPAFDLIETMRFDAHDGLLNLELHLARLKASAQAFGFSFDRHALRNELQAATFRLREEQCVRLRASPTGAVAIEVKPMPATPMLAEVAIVKRPVTKDDFRLIHKTSDRSFYDEARLASEAFEIAFVDEAGFVTEGSFTNIFVPRNGVYLTPPLSRALLPGVLRARMIEDGTAREEDLTPLDLASGFFIGNALRGLIPAQLVAGANAPGL